MIKASGEDLLAILNDILDLSKIEAGKLEIEEITFDLTELLRGAYSAFTAIANKKGLSFALDADSAAGAYVGDPTRIPQIIYNLVSNALKFTSQGEIRVVARREQDDLVILIRDTGIGMSSEVLHSLFEKFVQADASTTRRFGGTGLGLAICKHLSTLMGGSIAVDSVVGKGSDFMLRLPLKYCGSQPSLVAASTPEVSYEENRGQSGLKSLWQRTTR